MKKSGNFLKKLSKNGFYIILFLCICAIGISGYVMFRGPNVPDDTQVMGDWDSSLELPIPQDETKQYDFESAIASKPVETPKSDTETKTPATQPQAQTETKKPETSSKTTAKPANAVAVAKDTSGEAQTISYVAAVNGTVSLPYSGDELVKSQTLGDWRTHTGVDIAAPEGTKVCAIADGVVKDVYEDEMMGYTVVIEHKAGTVSTYSNLQKGVVVKKGQQVKAGEVIGGVGSSALAECMEEPHLHLELTNNNQTIDPMSVIKES